ncbi:MAG: HAMP domain-containing histidine kinase [Lachnospiraceae bacterium]|nr:HAMP domain-containing histidine kinase [Lachnospiraceae bacterium]
MKNIKYVLFIVASLLFLGGAFSNADRGVKERTEGSYLRLLGSVYEEDEELAARLAAQMYENEENEAFEVLGTEVLAAAGYGREGREYLYELQGNRIFFRRLMWITLSLFGIWVFLFCRLLWKREAMEKRLQEKEAELERLQKERDYLEERYGGEKGKANALIENIAHQIRTPLTNISLHLEILELETLSEEGMRQLHSCYQHIEHIKNLIHCLLRTGELEQERVHFSFESIGLKQLITETVSRVEESVGKGRVRLTGETKADQQLAVDISWMKEALCNIIGNCIRYSPDESVVEIEYRESAHQANILIRDKGIGISEEDRPYIFDRFYRSPNNRNQDGFGVGLNMAKLTVEAHHGTLTVDSGKDGSCFKVLLPVL